MVNWLTVKLSFQVFLSCSCVSFSVAWAKMSPSVSNKRRRLLLMKKKLLLMKKKRQEQQTGAQHRRFWVHPINQLRDSKGVFGNLVTELRDHPDRHMKYLRMSPENFDAILHMIRPLITKQDTVMRKSIQPAMKLAVTLHHLAKGASHVSIAAHYRLGRSTVSMIINDTCKAIWEAMSPLYLSPPSGPTEWNKIAQGLVRCF